MKIDFTFEDIETLNINNLERSLLRAANICFKLLKIKKGLSFSCSIVGDEQIKKMNNDYRGIKKVTDVLSFGLFFELDLDQKKMIARNSKVVELGDIFICKSRVIEQAKQYGHSIDREVHFLFVHGLLHLMGYDHQTNEDEELMIMMQEEILSKLKKKRKDDGK